MKLSNVIRQYLDRKKVAGREIHAYDDDIFIVSYPKSGNTWMRFLVANLVNPETTVGFDNIDKLVPDIYANTEKRLNQVPSPRTLKSHEYFDPRYKKTIYIVRDPRDIAVSYWHHHLKCRLVNERDSIDEFVSSFVHGSLDPFGTWHEHVGSWIGARQHTPDFLLLRYEDILSDPYRAAKRISTLASLAVSDEDIQHAVSESSFSSMSRKERMHGAEWALKHNTREDLPFVRKGTSRQWKYNLNPTAVRIIEDRFGEYMKELRYID